MRLFVAMNFDETVRKNVAAATRPLHVPEARVRWVSPRLFHITVNFLGEVHEGQVEDIADVVDGVASDFRPFEIGLGGLGVFPSPTRPRTIWMGCAQQPALELIQNQLAERLVPLGFEPEGRRFNPHVTIGRVKRNTTRGQLDPVLQRLDDIGFETYDFIESLDLMKSTMTESGSDYECIHKSMLGVV